MLENTEGAIKTWKSRETVNIGYTSKKHNTICVGHHYAQTNTNNVNIRTPDFHFEQTIMILHIIDKLLIQVVNIYFLSWKFYCI